MQQVGYLVLPTNLLVNADAKKPSRDMAGVGCPQNEGAVPSQQLLPRQCVLQYHSVRITNSR